MRDRVKTAASDMTSRTSEYANLSTLYGSMPSTPDTASEYDRLRLKETADSGYSDISRLLDNNTNQYTAGPVPNKKAPPTTNYGRGYQSAAGIDEDYVRRNYGVIPSNAPPTTMLRWRTAALIGVALALVVSLQLFPAYATQRNVLIGTTSLAGVWFLAYPAWAYFTKYPNVSLWQTLGQMAIPVVLAVVSGVALYDGTFIQAAVERRV